MNKKIIKSGVKFLLRHKLQSFFMILGVMIGVIFLCLTFAIGSSTEKQILDKMKGFFSSNNIFIMAGKGMKRGGPRSEGSVTTLKLEDMEAVLNAVPGVIRFDPMQTLSPCEVIYGNVNISTTIQGRSVDGEVVWNRTVTSGEYLNKEDVESAARVALLGSKIEKQLFGDSNPLRQQIRIGSVLFTVKGVLEEKGTDPHGNNLDMEVIVPITTMMSRLKNVDYIPAAKLEVDETKMAEIAEKIKTVLRERHSLNADVSDDFSVMTPVQAQEMVQKMKKIFTLYLPLISGVILLLSGIIISILMLISVSRRVSEIGLRKAVGASPKDIMLQFVFESVMISLIGGLLGLLIGLIGTWAIITKLGYTFYLPWQPIVLGVLLPVIVGILAGIIPARKAANLDPVKSLA
ncbi:MAG: ABC transporter permease [Bacteroidia bacterium]|nr:ABC transporter permease [Bacteroidia bacterium]